MGGNPGLPKGSKLAAEEPTLFILTVWLVNYAKSWQL